MLIKRLIVHDCGPANAALNMAIDEALLEQAAEPVLRFYKWERAALSFGYFGKFADVAEEAARRDIVRRWTGGGVVLHGKDLTYSLITPASDTVSTEGPRAIYAALHRAIQDALLAEGRETELAAKTAPKISDACFANPVRDDLMWRGRKIAGAAQRRTRGGFLHQGSIQLLGLSQPFRDRFASALSATTRKEELPLSILERAAALAAEKYGDEAWLRRW